MPREAWSVPSWRRRTGSTPSVLPRHWRVWEPGGQWEHCSFGFTGAEAARVEVIYFVVVVPGVLATVAMDRGARRTAPRRATAVAAFSLKRRPM